MARPKILIIEDEKLVRWSLQQKLMHEGYDIESCATGEEGVSLVRDDGFDVVLLDIRLPGMDGVQVLREIKALEKDVAVIMLTARAEEQDKVSGLEGGADDYVTKPFSPRELLARINAVLRRSSPAASDEVVAAGGLRLDGAGHRVTCGEATVPLGPTEYRLLSFFMTHAERVYSRSQLLDRVWGGNVYVEERTVDVHIRRLRKALESFNVDSYIQTVRGAGYRFSTRPT